MESKCIICGLKTNKKNNICVLCENGMTLVHKDLIDLLKKDKKCNLLKTIIMIEEGEQKSSDRRNHLRSELPFSVLEYYLNPPADYRTFIGFTIDISDFGLCLKTSQLLNLGQKIIIKSLLFAASKRAIVRWTEKLDDSFYKIGLEFI